MWSTERPNKINGVAEKDKSEGEDVQEVSDEVDINNIDRSQFF